MTLNLKNLTASELANLGMEICEFAPTDILSEEEVDLIYSGFQDNCYETEQDEAHLFWLAKEHPLLIIKCLVGSSRHFTANGRESDKQLGLFYEEILLRILN